MYSAMAMKLIVVLYTLTLITGLSGTSSVFFHYYYFVNESMTWLEAQSYCRAKYTDLATVDNMEDMKRLMKRVDPKLSSGLWIGLNKVPPRRWGWSSGEISQYMNWTSGEPNGGDRDGLCGANEFSSWIDDFRQSFMDFVCYSELNRTFIHISLKLTWRSAQDYCRQHYTDLATVHNEEEQRHLSNLLRGVRYAWIGLFFDNWKWSDQQNSTFRYWRSGQPWSSTGNADCVMVTGWNGQWDAVRCDAEIPFMCYKGSSDVFGLVGSSVQLNIQYPVSEFDDLFWVFNRTDNVLKYYKEFNDTKPFPRDKDRVEFNKETHSLTLKNLQKTDSGLYKAEVSGDEIKYVAVYKLSVFDPVETPVLSLVLHQQSRDACNIILTCKGHDLSINSSCYKETCEEKTATSQAVVLSLFINGSSIICNHSNPVSWRASAMKMETFKQLWDDEVCPPAGVSVCLLKTVLYSISLVIMISAVLTVHLRERLIKSS